MANNLDYGIETTIQENELIDLNELISNPFYVGIKKNPLNDINDRELYGKYKKVYIMCKRNETRVDSDKILDKTISIKCLEDCLKCYTLVSSSMEILKNKLHKRCAMIVEKKYLEKIIENEDYEENELLILLNELNENEVRKYLLVYKGENDIENLIKIIIYNEYFSVNKNLCKIANNISQLSRNVNDINYWTNNWNCEINITELYKNRNFRIKEENGKVTGILIGENNRMNNEKAKFFETRLKNNNYLENINDENNDKYTDISGNIQDGSYKRYKINNYDINITKKQLTDIFNKLENERELYDLFNAFLLSKEYCHLVINNLEILKIMKPIISKYLPVYRYLLGYAWLTLYMEESIMKTRISEDSRFVFDIETASELPLFPFSAEDPHINPYFILPVDKSTMKSNRNCHTMGWIEKYSEYGISTLSSFKKKLNIFASGDSKKDIFDGIEQDSTGKWKNFAISGSVMTACTMKRNPLIDILNVKQSDKSKDIETEKWTRFFNEYYQTSDIDILCTKVHMFDFIDETQKLVQVIKNNIIKHNNLTECDIVVEDVKTSMIIFTKKYIEMCTSDEIKDELLDNINKNKNISNEVSEEIKNHFYGEYIMYKQLNNRKNRKSYMANIKKNPLYKYYYNFTDQDNLNIYLTDSISYISPIDIVIKMNDILDEKVSEDKNEVLMKISEGLRFKIKSSYLQHSLELFKTKYPEAFSCVSRFHLPCVRGYYNGKTVKLLPSNITALMTMTNIDYKYFAGSKDPIDIINKYRMRGFGIILNDTEKKYMIEYNKKFMSPNKSNDKFGVLDINKSEIFKPGKSKNFSDDDYSKTEHEYSNYQNILEYYKYNYTSDRMVNFENLRTINNLGNIEPLKRWVLDAGYEAFKANELNKFYVEPGKSKYFTRKKKRFMKPYSK